MELMQLLVEAQNARSRRTASRCAFLDAQKKCDSLRRESIWINDPTKYQKCIDALNVADRTLTQSRLAASKAEEDYNLAVTALLDFGSDEE